ncbi:MAG: homoaconitate hydratase [Chloroflexota bacterium]|nr:homoaconitate hydratase [Chloroflexota bacterium]
MPRIWKFGDDVDTDQILPGRYAPYMTSEEELARYAFIEHRPEFSQLIQEGDIIVAGENFGCGSSREYAPRALKKCGVAAIVAQSFARIFYRNALNLGIPLFEADIAGQVEDGTEVELDVEGGVLRVGEHKFQLPPPPEFVRQTWATGGIVNYFRQHGHFPS